MIDYALTLPQSVRDLLVRFATRRVYEELGKSTALRTSAVERIDDRALREIQRVLPPSCRKAAVYYGAGRDLITPIHVLHRLTGQLDYVYISGFDEMFVPGEVWLRSVFAQHAIQLQDVSVKQRSMSVRLNGLPMSLGFGRADNTLFARFGPGGIIYVSGLASTIPSELVRAHLYDDRQAGVLTFFLPTAEMTDLASFFTIRQLAEDVCSIRPQPSQTA